MGAFFWTSDNSTFTVLLSVLIVLINVGFVLYLGILLVGDTIRDYLTCIDRSAAHTAREEQKAMQQRILQLRKTAELNQHHNEQIVRRRILDALIARSTGNTTTSTLNTRGRAFLNKVITVEKANHTQLRHTQSKAKITLEIQKKRTNASQRLNKRLMTRQKSRRMQQATVQASVKPHATVPASVRPQATVQALVKKPQQPVLRVTPLQKKRNKKETNATVVVPNQVAKAELELQITKIQKVLSEQKKIVQQIMKRAAKQGTGVMTKKMLFKVVQSLIKKHDVNMDGALLERLWSFLKKKSLVDEIDVVELKVLHEWIFNQATVPASVTPQRLVLPVAPLQKEKNIEVLSQGNVNTVRQLTKIQKLLSEQKKLMQQVMKRAAEQGTGVMTKTMFFKVVQSLIKRHDMEMDGALFERLWSFVKRKSLVDEIDVVELKVLNEWMCG